MPCNLLKNTIRSLFRIVVFAISLVAFILSADTVGSCRYLITEPDGRAIGLYAYEDPNNVDRVCQSVAFLKDASEVEIFADEDLWKAAQGLGTAGAVLGGIAALFMFLGFFCNLCAKWWCFKAFLPLMLLSAGFCTLLTNIVFGVDMCSDLEGANGTVIQERACTSSSGNSDASGAFILYVVAALSMSLCMTPWETPMYKFVDELSSETADAGGEHTDDKAAEPTEGLNEQEVTNV